MILIKNIHTLYTGGPQPEELHNVHLHLCDGKVEGIYEGAVPVLDHAVDEIDGSSLLIIPGLINLHHHFYQTLTRNLPGAQQAELFDWLVYLYPIWAGIGLEAVRSATTIAAAELLSSGCTTSVDHFYLYPHGQNELFDAEIEAAKNAGLRLALCRGSMSLSKKDGGLPPDHVTQSVADIMKHSQAVIDTYHSGEAGAMVQVILAPCSPFSVSEDLMRESKKLGEDRGVICHTHLAETRDEEVFCIEKYGYRPLDYLEKLGWLDDRTFLAHMVWLNDEERERVAASGVGIAHCPTSNMRLGSGIAPVTPLLAAGAHVGIAVDGSASNDCSHMMNEVRQTMLLQRVKYGASAISARDVLNMATWGGAQILHRPDLGQINPGATADVVGIDINRLHFAGGLSDPIAAAVFCIVDHVDLTIVNGQKIVQEGQFINLDLPQAIEEHNRLARELANK